MIALMIVVEMIVVEMIVVETIVVETIVAVRIPGAAKEPTAAVAALCFRNDRRD